MIRILLFLFVVFCLGVGFAWLADRPGELVITFSGYQYEITLMVAAVAGVAVVALVMIAWWVIKSIWNSPRAVNRYFRARRRDRGYQSLSTGLIAAGSGDTGLAHKMRKQVSGLLSSDQEPLLHLLDAQTMLLEGKHEDARNKFEQMLDDPETRLLGLRGLYLEAQRMGERDAARHYAEQAADSAPQLIWASNAAIETRTMEQNWDGALKLLDSQLSTKQISREDADRRRAVLLTARSIDVLDTDPALARNVALEAHKLMPDFVPAAVASGRALYRQGEIRKGTKILESIWKKNPHPEIAEIYVHARSGDSTHDRLKRARRLQSLRKNHVESAMAVARAANGAGEFTMAREALEAAIKLEPRESAYLLLADIEENETGDQGRVRHWLSKAVRAPRDPAWTADGYVSEHWAPVSPITGVLGAFEWKVPVERLGSVIEAEDSDVFAEIPIIPEPDSGKDAGPEAIVVEAEPVAVVEAAPDQATEEDLQAAEPAVEEDVADKADEPDTDTSRQEDDDRPEENEEIKADGATAPEAHQTPAPAVDDADAADIADESDTVPLQPIPDDPGVEKDPADKEAPGRFRLF